MALVVKTMMSLEITNAPTTFFKSGPMTNATDLLTQSFGVDVLLDPAVVNQEISLQGVDVARQLFLLCDQPVEIVLDLLVAGVPQPTPPIVLTRSVPNLISFSNVVGIRATNPTADPARLMVYGAGVEL